MHKLSFNQQIQKLNQLANTRQINPSDYYLLVYPELLQAIQSLLPLDSQKLLLTAHAVFGWMPTQLRVDMSQLGDALIILNGVLQTGEKNLPVNYLIHLATTFKTTGGNSVVAASKILHFLAPDRFPIWDSKVAKTWGVPPSGPRAAANYSNFIQACQTFAADTGGKVACDVLRQRLALAGFQYPMSDMRIIELMFFLP